ncbi:MAG: hypothetical protein KDD62_04200, partial [Bdellovibrionales bacterium]|nr:hypothetical protein [Bdellovibrionales bacterium]
VVSPFYNDGKADYAQFADRLGLEVVVEKVILIPFCDVGGSTRTGPNGSGKSKSLVLISLTKSDAKKFHKYDVLPTIKIDGDSLPADRPQQIHEALRERSRYRKMFRDSYEKRQELFPVVDVLFLKKKGSDQLLMPFHELATDESGATTTLLKELLERNTEMLSELTKVLKDVKDAGVGSSS